MSAINAHMQAHPAWQQISTWRLKSLNGMPSSAKLPVLEDDCLLFLFLIVFFGRILCMYKVTESPKLKTQLIMRTKLRCFGLDVEGSLVSAQD